MDSLITECPSCGTAFRVTQAQLAIADGTVRCGTCMHIFQAVTPRQDVAEDERQQDHRHAHEHDTGNDGDDLYTLSPEMQALGEAPLSARRHSDSESNGEFEGDTGSSPRYATDSDASEEAVWAAKLLEEEEHDNVFSASSRPKDEPISFDGDRSPAIGDEQILDDELNRQQILANIGASPVEIQFASRDLGLARKFAALCILLIGSAGLAAQAFWFNMEQWSLDTRYRPWYELACAQLGCTLPPLQDFKKIRTSNLVVRSHPDEPQALIIDAMITNQAPYQQDFPMLDVMFRDTQGSLVAARSFRPEEYLRGELEGKSQMPANTPIHFSLEIADPGSHASSYALQLRPMVL